METLVLMLSLLGFATYNFVAIYFILRAPRLDLSDNNLEKVIKEWEEET